MNYLFSIQSNQNSVSILEFNSTIYSVVIDRRMDFSQGNHPEPMEEEPKDPAIKLFGRTILVEFAAETAETAEAAEAETVEIVLAEVRVCLSDDLDDDDAAEEVEFSNKQVTSILHSNEAENGQNSGNLMNNVVGHEFTAPFSSKSGKTGNLQVVLKPDVAENDFNGLPAAFLDVNGKKSGLLRSKQQGKSSKSGVHHAEISGQHFGAEKE